MFHGMPNRCAKPCGWIRVLESAWEIRGLHTEKLSSGRKVSPSNTRLLKIAQRYYHITVDFAKAASQTVLAQLNKYLVS